MKKLSLVLYSVLAVIYVSAQDSWTIKLDKKTILSTNKEDEAANTRNVTIMKWKKKRCLRVIYRDENKRQDWYRSLFITDENDNEIARTDSVNMLNISLKELTGKQKIKIFTTITPSDPELAARVRIRRVHLCTLELP